MTTPLVSDALRVTVDPTTVAYRTIRTERHRDLRAVDLPGLCPDLREDTDSSRPCWSSGALVAMICHGPTVRAVVPCRRPWHASVGHEVVGGGAPAPTSRHDGVEDTDMAWMVLIVSGVLEAVWATALGKSEGFSRPVPSVVFAIAIVASMAGLAFAMRELPVSTAYAVWVGIGAVLTASYAMVFDGEPVSLVRILLLLGIVGCVIGLKVLH